MLECIDRYNARGHALDLEEAVVHGREAARLRAYRRLSKSHSGPHIAINHSDDLAQDVALAYWTKINKLAEKLGGIEDPKGRLRFLTNVNINLVASAIRHNLRGPKIVQMEDADALEHCMESQPGCWTVAASSPDVFIRDFEQLQTALESSERLWKRNKACSKAGGWAPWLEMTGHTDVTDRPAVIAKRSCQELLKKSKAAAKKRLLRSRNASEPEL